MKRKSQQQGMSIIELMFCAVIVLFAIGVISKMLIAGSQSVEVGDLGQRARVAADDALTALGSQPSVNLPEQGSFSVEDTNLIRITVPCNPQTCDYVDLDQRSESDEPKSPANGFPYDSTSSTVTRLKNKLLRRWLVEDVEPELNLKRITVAVMSDERSLTPIRIEKTIVGINR